MLDPTYAYFIGVLFFFPVWCIFFLLRKDLRIKLIVMSILIGILAPLWEQYFLSDYWHPHFLYVFHFYLWDFGLEDFLYGFFAGGVASVIYQQVCNKKNIPLKKRQYRWQATAFLVTLAVALFHISLYLLKLHSIYAAFITFIGLSATITWLRKDLLPTALISGVLFAITTFIFYLLYLQLFPQLIAIWWDSNQLSNIFFYRVPFEEILWAFTMGTAVGPAYEFINGLKVISVKGK